MVRSVPDGVTRVSAIVDRYVTGTRLRLRELREVDENVVRKLGHKARLSDGPAEVACTSVYLDDAEWRLLDQLPARVLRKRRHHVERDGIRVAVDEFEDGSLLAGDRRRRQAAGTASRLARRRRRRQRRRGVDRRSARHVWRPASPARRAPFRDAGRLALTQTRASTHLLRAQDVPYLPAVAVGLRRSLSMTHRDTRFVALGVGERP